MYLPFDNIRARLNYEEYGLRLEHADVLSNTDVYENAEIPYLTGYFKGIYVCSSYSGITISNSFAKAVNGNNFEPLSQEDFYKLVQELSKLLKVDLFKAKVTSLEISIVIQANYSIIDIQNQVLELPRHIHKEYDNGFYFLNTQRTIKVYNKINEMRGKRKCKEITSDPINTNRLRVEIEPEIITKELNCNHQTLSSIAKPEFTQKALDYLLNWAYSIKFKPDVLNEPKETLTENELKAYSLIRFISKSNESCLGLMDVFMGGYGNKDEYNSRAKKNLYKDLWNKKYSEVSKVENDFKRAVKNCLDEVYSYKGDKVDYYSQ